MESATAPAITDLPTVSQPAEPHIPELQLDAWRVFVSAHAALVERIERALADEQLPPLGWCDVLWALYRAPGNGLRPRDLGLHLTISKSGLTRLLDRIEAAELIERQDCEADRRGYVIVLTDSGRRMLREIWPVYARALAATFGDRISDEEAASLRDLLTRLQEIACDAAGA
jgi:DNA-binding MarR family transcriptional regulator